MLGHYRSHYHGRPYRMSERLNFFILLTVAAVFGCGIGYELLKLASQ